jgi:hypothetical protein
MHPWTDLAPACVPARLLSDTTSAQHFVQADAASRRGLTQALGLTAMWMGILGALIVLLGGGLVAAGALAYDYSLWLLLPGVALMLVGASFLDGFRNGVIQGLNGRIGRRKGE